MDERGWVSFNCVLAGHRLHVCGHQSTASSGEGVCGEEQKSALLRNTASVSCIWILFNKGRDQETSHQMPAPLGTSR